MVKLKDEANVLLGISVSEAVRDAVTLHAAQHKMTKRQLILNALRAYGVELPKETIMKPKQGRPKSTG
jgi:hypothetical protein